MPNRPHTYTTPPPPAPRGNPSSFLPRSPAQQEAFERAQESLARRGLRRSPAPLRGITQPRSIPRVTTPRPTTLRPPPAATRARPRGLGRPPLSSLQSADPLLLCELGMLPCDPGYSGPQPPEPPFLGGQMPGVAYIVSYGSVTSRNTAGTDCYTEVGTVLVTGPITSISTRTQKNSASGCIRGSYGLFEVVAASGRRSLSFGTRTGCTGLQRVARADGVPDTGGNPPPLPEAPTRRGINPNGPAARHRLPVQPPTLRLVPASPPQPIGEPQPQPEPEIPSPLPLYPSPQPTIAPERHPDPTNPQPQPTPAVTPAQTPTRAPSQFPTRAPARRAGNVPGTAIPGTATPIRNPFWNPSIQPPFSPQRPPQRPPQTTPSTPPSTIPQCPTRRPPATIPQTPATGTPTITPPPPTPQTPETPVTPSTGTPPTRPPTRPPSYSSSAPQPPIPTTRPPNRPISQPSTGDPTVSDPCQGNACSQAIRRDIADNRNRLNELQAGMQALDLAGLAEIMAKLNRIDNKLGPQLVGGISGFLQNFKAVVDKFVKWSHLDRILNVLTFITVVHNAFMLSNQIGQTLMSAISQGLAVIGIKDEEGNELDINSIIGTAVENAIKSIIGEENYTTMSAQWKRASRIYQAASNILFSLQSMMYSVLESLEIVGSYVAKIGNAAKRFGTFAENCYAWMNPNPNFTQNRFFRFLDTTQEVVENIDEVAGEVLSVQEMIPEIGSQSEQLRQAMSGVDESGQPYPSGFDVPENIPILTAEVSNDEESQSPPILPEHERTPVVVSE